jgi:phospholipase C
MSLRKSLLCASFCVSTAITAIAPAAYAASTAVGGVAPVDPAWAEIQVDNEPTATPIKHLVVIYDENVSFDHYFATYPSATNPSGEPVFTAAPGTPTVNNLVTANLLTNNPNFTNTANGVNAAEPFRLDHSQAATADQNHGYTAEQEAYDNGKADLFPEFTGHGTSGGVGAFGTNGQVMGYYDGNTVTALWNYANHYAMSDKAYTDTYGPSTPGALEVVSGQTNGFEVVKSTSSSYYVPDGQGGLTLMSDVDPGYDACSSATNQGMLTGKNIGDLLNAARIPWGGFMGGFNLGVTNANGTTGCARSTVSTTVGETVADYVPHHNWFQYFASTANPTHARPAALVSVGYTFDHNGAVDPANHQYDLRDFLEAAKVGYLPAVSYVKLAAYQDGHAGYSDPLDEQGGLVQVINTLQRTRDWKNTAVIVTYDDSDGWYDHAYATPTSPSYSTADLLNGTATCGTGVQRVGLSEKPVNGRCGPGTRIPFLVISPWAKQNYVGSTLITQASVVQFIEQNWLKGRRLGGGSFDISTGSIMPLFNFSGHGNAPQLLLNPTTGEPLHN